MKLERWILYVVATICFVICFIGLNTKYDPFYRVSGINNENRVLIELYLDEQEQQYLIDCGVSFDKFIQYIEFDSFYLPNYKYYPIMDKAKYIKDKEEMLQTTNEIIDRLEATNIKNIPSTFSRLVVDNLVFAFLENDEFNCKNISYYQIVRSLYGDHDYDYIKDTNKYIEMLDLYDYATTNEELDDTLNTLVNNYEKDSLNLLLTTTLLEGQKIVINPSQLGVVIDETTYIASYEPHDLVIATEIPRLLYTTYLQSGTYNALKEMRAKIKEDLGDVLLLREGYSSYSSLMVNENGNAGFNKFQTGTYITVQELGTTVLAYPETKLYSWMKEYAHEYGFIQETEGTNSYRYVGSVLAREFVDALQDNVVNVEE